jgi:signal transduction histidine kinase
MVAHQFRRPITEINYMTELLLDGTYGAISDEQRESITNIQAASAKKG